MTQTLRGRVIRNDNISVGNATGTENAVAPGVPGPAFQVGASGFPVIENTTLGTTATGPATGAAASPYGIEKYGSTGTTSPNPERPQSGT